MDIKAIIIDDEPLAIQGLQSHLSKIGFIRLVASCEDAVDAMNFLSNNEVDLMFLDIQMPELSGIDFLRTLRNPPMAIITTAFPEFAIQGFELDVLDYLVKPITFERFLKACNKANEYFGLLNNGAKGRDYFFIKCGKTIEKIHYNEVLFVEAAQNYTIIHTDHKKHATYLTFKSIEDFLPQNDFIRVQKSYIVPFARINSIDGDDIIIKDRKIPMSPRSKDEILKKILKDNYLKRD